VGYPPFYSDEPMSTCRKVRHLDKLHEYLFSSASLPVCVQLDFGESLQNLSPVTKSHKGLL
jgi:hypothetical protein